MIKHSILSSVVRGIISKIGCCFGKKKPFGITVLIPLFNEEKTIRHSLLSIMDVADQIIILDTSFDSSYDQIKDLLVNPKIEYYRFVKSKHSFIGKLNFGLEKVQFRFVWKFGGDFILDDEAVTWKKRLRDVIGYVYVDCTHLNFKDYEVYHLTYSWEMFIFTYHPSLRFCVANCEQIRGIFSFGKRFPLFYKGLMFPEKYIYHVDLKDEFRRKNRRLFFGFDEVENYDEKVNVYQVSGEL